jgi:putative ABC transport system permease protein
MRLFDVSLNNLRRRKGRMVLLVLGLTIGVATVVALTAITSTLRADIANKLDQYGANILIVPKANDLSLSYGGVTVASAAFDVGELTLADLDQLQTIKNARNISVVSPKLLAATSVNGQNVLVAGVRFADELRLKQWWHVVAGTEPAGPDDALMGSRLALTLGMRPGDPIEIKGHSFQVVGLLAENGSQDDDILFIDLATAQQVMNKPGSVSLAEVAALCTACPIEDMVQQMSGVLPQARVTALRQAVKLRMDTVGQLERFALAVSAVVVVIGSLVVLTTMLGAVAERRQEIGLFRALGFRQGHVMRIILSEAALVSVVGGLLGWLLGMGAAVLLAPRLASVTTPVIWNLWIALAALGGALLVGLLASLYPARSAARLDPSIALRSL